MACNLEITSLTIRAVQVVFAIIALGLAAGILGDINYSFDRVNLTVAVSVLNLIWLAPLFYLPVLRRIPIAVILVLESVFFVLWLSSFAVTADTFGSVSCSGTVNTYYNTYHYDAGTWCKIGKALIAITLISWLLSAASLVLFVIYGLVPLTNSVGTDSAFRATTNNLAIGGIIGGAAAHAVPDLETGEAAVDSGVVPASTDEEIKPNIDLDEDDNVAEEKAAVADSAHDPAAEPAVEPVVEPATK